MFSINQKLTCSKSVSIFELHAENIAIPIWSKDGKENRLMNTNIILFAINTYIEFKPTF